MAKKNRTIPFDWLPASWGLSGESYDEAKANYELDGEDLARALVDIRVKDPEANRAAHIKLDFAHGLITEYEHDYRLAASEQERLAVDLKYNIITPWDYDCRMAEIRFPDPDSMDQQLALLEADYAHGKITKQEYEKTYAIATDQPWVGIIDNGFESKEGVNGLYFELDWNDQWVEFLKKNGYQGMTDDQIVEQWFSDVCRSQAAEAVPDEPVPFGR